MCWFRLVAHYIHATLLSNLTRAADKYRWVTTHRGDIGIGSACRVIADASASKRQVPPDAPKPSETKPVTAGTTLTVTEVKGGAYLYLVYF